MKLQNQRVNTSTHSLNLIRHLLAHPHSPLHILSLIIRMVILNKLQLPYLILQLIIFLLKLLSLSLHSSHHLQSIIYQFHSNW